MSVIDRWTTIADVVASARLAMPPPLWEFSGSGPEGEVTVRRNRAVFDRYALLPRHLRAVDHLDLSTSFLGHHLALPVMLAPIGLIQMFDHKGALGPARAAAKCGTISFVGANSEPSLEETRESCSGPLIFQLYTYGDREWIARLIRRVERAGYDAICLTVDCPSAGLRDRFLANDFESTRRKGAHPNIEPVDGGGEQWLGRFTWEELGWLRATTKLPLILKGILSPLDAAEGVRRGVDAIHISNHGGRRQDQLPATLDLVPAILEAVGDEAEVVVDSGFLRGTDVVKALALGVRAVLVGKLMMWSLATAGEDGVVRALEILGSEISATMANVGAASLGDLSPEMVIPSFAPPPAPWPVEPMRIREG